jgi:outer membrane protein
MKKKLSLLLVSFMFLGSVYAQKKWSLQDCINYAIENNIRIQREKLNAKVAENNLFQSKMEFLPSINAGASNTFNYGRNPDPTTYEIVDVTYTTQYGGISGDLRLFRGMRTLNGVKQNEFNLMARLNDVENLKDNISINVATSYLDILFNYELVEIAENQVDIARQEVERAEKLVEVGNLAKGELLKLNAQLESDKYQLTNANNNLTLSYITLTQLLEMDTISGFEIDVPEELPVDEQINYNNVGEIYSVAVKDLPYIKSAEFDLKSFEKNLDVVKGSRYPQVYLNTEWYTYYSSRQRELFPWEEQIREFQSQTVRIGINIPIFTRYQIKNSINNASIQVDDAKYALDQRKKDLFMNIQQAYADATGALDKYNAAVEAVASADEAFNYTQQKFNVGLISSVDFNIAKAELVKAQSDMLQAKFEYIFKSKILDFYMGKTIEL